MEKALHPTLDAWYMLTLFYELINVCFEQLTKCT